jgi:hypothetical protein
MKLSHSRMPFVRAYFRETQELVFDAHDKALHFYGAVCRRGIYDNMKTAVEAIFVGKARQYNRRFLQMCSHHLIEPVACAGTSFCAEGLRVLEGYSVGVVLIIVGHGPPLGINLRTPSLAGFSSLVPWSLELFH